MNRFQFIGRLCNDYKLKKIGERDVYSCRVAVQRDFKNAEGVYETDFMPITFWQPYTKQFFERLKKGDLVLVEGRVANYNEIDPDSNMNKDKIGLVGESIRYLAGNNSEMSDEDEE